MIGYKKNILEKQSFSEVKMGRGSLICKKQDVMKQNETILEQCSL